MSFRQPKSHRHAQDHAWQQWYVRHVPALKALSLPPSVVLSESHWRDFLQNGYLEWHPESRDGFAFDQLSIEQMAGLLEILEASPAYASEPMVGWLQVRLGRAG
jgi:hypothetical protein